MPQVRADDENLLPLTLEECLSSNVERVLKDDIPNVSSRQTIFAVFDRVEDNGSFRGVIDACEIGNRSDLTFGDLANSHPTHSLVSHATAYEALYVMQQELVSVISVRDVFGQFLGVVTHQSMLMPVLEREYLVLERSRTLAQLILDVKRKAHLDDRRLSELTKASQPLINIMEEELSEFDLIQIGLDEISKLIPVRYLALGVFDNPENMELKHFLTYDMSEAEIELVGDKPMGHGLLGIVIEDNKPLIIEDMSKDPRHVGFPENHPMMKSLLAIPVSRAGRAYGQIYLSDKLDGTAFSNADSLVLQNFVQSLSMALNRTREVEENLSRYEYLDHVAHSDALTGLPNRTLLFDRIQQSILNARRKGNSVVVMFIDLDDFKQINDTYGHAVGDDVLKMAGSRISSCIREADTVARLGGDEFVILLPEAIDTQASANVARRILEAMSEPFQIDQHELSVTASIGISTHGPFDETTAEELFQSSDKAMYRAKKMGKNNFQFSVEKMEVPVHNSPRRKMQLLRAIEKNELFLEYQPQIFVETLHVVGVEALVRWKSEEFGLVLPNEFIPLAEEIGMIAAISSWVLRTACLQGRIWQEAGTPIRIGINLSGDEFQPRNLKKTVDMILTTLRETEFPRELLDLELTEGILVPHLGDSKEGLSQLRAEGIRLALDDFGTGFSSLSYLKHLPTDTVKIDRSFVHDVLTDPDSASIIRAVLSMAQEMNLNIVVEGVESKEQMEFLRDLGCEIMQGFYFSKPLSVEEVTVLLETGTSNSISAPTM